MNAGSTPLSLLRHDLCSALNQITGYAELSLEEGALNEAGRQAVRGLIQKALEAVEVIRHSQAGAPARLIEDSRSHCRSVVDEVSSIRGCPYADRIEKAAASLAQLLT
jgi:light-regulated signal transduction histidine kinase (bacteriophytochrome)